MNVYRSYGPRAATPQSQPIPGRADQIPNSAGGFVFRLGMWEQAERFLILGTSSSTYYASAQELTRQNAEVIEACVKENGPRLVQLVVAISQAGRAPKNDPALFALALAIALGDVATKQAVAEALPKVARTGTHIVHFAALAQSWRGWGPALVHAVQNWYLSQSPSHLLFQAIKYASRDGWSQRDVLRKAHPKTSDRAMNAVLRYIVTGVSANDGEHPWPADGDALFAQVNAVHLLTPGRPVGESAYLIREHRIPRECVPTELLKHPEIWRALLQDMPLGALVRNIATMTRNGALKPGDFATIEAVSARLQDAERIKKARLHPLAFLVALRTYASGKSVRGSGSWEPIQDIVDALDAGFYAAFDAIAPMNKRILLGVDVSGSMSSGTIAGLPGVTPRAAACAFALQVAKTEPHRHIAGFSNRFMPLAISPAQRLDEVIGYTEHLPFEGTDCALPMQWALQNEADIDLFWVITDNETWSGSQHPVQALQQYRAKRVPDAKLAVLAMTATGCTIADPLDSGMLDVVGCDTATPAVLRDFVCGSVATAPEEEDPD